ncbi:hypothetical protein V2J09_016979 [Rumex salicifolius]
MGCVTSKEAVTVTPTAIDSTVGFNAPSISGRRDGVETVKSSSARSMADAADSAGMAESVASWAADSGGRDSSTNTTCGSESVSFRLGNLQKYVEGEQAAAGWPSWLTAVAGEAIQGWIPLRPDSFEKLEKVGQGTYSSVFRARDHETGKIVALKKVRFDSLEPESVRFMAREISILRRLDHPNIIKLEGIITSRLSCSIYLVFEYMEHDLAGLSSCPDINFTESQVADFGLANFFSLSNKQPLTSRVVTLWYRPPELLLGVTKYTPAVDLWSAGCVFAEVLLGKPILQGRTEVEQIHKIFKLCGSPPDEYWKKSRLPHATLFKPQHRYLSCLNDTCKDLPTATFSLIETLLSYFTTKPYACDPSSLPKYPPNKEIDAKCREEARKKRISGSGRARGIDTLRKASRKPNGIRKFPPTEINTQRTKINGKIALFPSEQETRMRREEPKVSIHESQEDVPYSGPILVPSSSGFAWAKKQRDEACMRSYSRLEQSHPTSTSTSVAKMSFELRRSGSQGVSNGSKANVLLCEVDKPAVQRQWSHLDSFDDCDDENDDEYHSQELSMALYKKELEAKRNIMGEEETVEFSGPLMASQSKKNKNGIDELLERHERRICQSVRRSWFQRGRWSSQRV